MCSLERKAMKKRDREALRRSICEGIRYEVREYLISSDTHTKNDEWCSAERDWCGPEVTEDCKNAYVFLFGLLKPAAVWPEATKEPQTW
jgi:hypothetical protein